LNDLIKLDNSVLNTGRLPFDLYDNYGSLLVHRGAEIKSEVQIDYLVDRGTFYLKQKTTAEKPKDAKTFTRLKNITSNLTLVFGLLKDPKADFSNEILILAQNIQSLCNSKPEAAIASLLLIDKMSYPVKHSVDVAVLTEILAKKNTIEKKERESLIAAALTMNISFIQLQEQLNQQQTALTKEQRESITRHPELSVQLLRQAGVDDSLWLKCVLQHHEQIDGSGYPNKLKGEQVFFSSQIINISDQYCARLSPRGRRDPDLHKGILRKIFLDEGHQLSAKLEKLFIKELGLYALGTVVQLANSEMGEVVKQGKNMASPVVMACYHPDVGEYKTPIQRNTSTENYQIREVINCEHSEAMFDRKAIWLFEETETGKETTEDESTINNITSEEQENIYSELDSEIEDLPLLPTAVSQLMSLNINDENYFNKVHHLAAQDPTFAVRIIKQANTVENNSISKITTLEHAIARIGTRQIKGLITTFAIAKIFIPTDKSESDLWVHSIQVAVAARNIAKLNKTIDPEQAYLSGLLHDIGRFILFKTIPDGPIKTDEKDWQNPEELVFAEQEACGLNHAVLGARASKKWQLSEDISHVISQHHSYSYQTETPEEKKLTCLNKIVQMADYFSMHVMKYPEILALPEQELQESLNQKCINSKWKEVPIQIKQLQEQAETICEQAENIFKGLNIQT
jgi:putative nucleotidyltransferase with HDIG domain